MTDGLAESCHLLANEPSVAFFRLQEHVRKAVPELVARKVTVSASRAQKHTPAEPGRWLSSLQLGS